MSMKETGAGYTRSIDEHLSAHTSMPHMAIPIPIPICDESFDVLHGGRVAVFEHLE